MTSAQDRTTDERPSSGTIAVVLAAGAGRRFEGPTHKLEARVDGDTLAGHAIRAALEAAIGPVVVVTGAITPSLGTDLADMVTFAHNPRWNQGQATSLQVAIEAARSADASSVVIGLADQPLVSPSAWRAVAEERSRPIAVATYDGVFGHPVRLDRTVWSGLPATGDSGARSLMHLRPELVCEVPCIGSPADIDTLEELGQWQNKSSMSSRSTDRSKKPGR